MVCLFQESDFRDFTSDYPHQAYSSSMSHNSYFLPSNIHDPSKGGGINDNCRVKSVPADIDYSGDYADNTNMVDSHRLYNSANTSVTPPRSRERLTEILQDTMHLTSYEKVPITSLNLTYSI